MRSVVKVYWDNDHYLESGWSRQSDGDTDYYSSAVGSSETTFPHYHGTAVEGEKAYLKIRRLNGTWSGFIKKNSGVEVEVEPEYSGMPSASTRAQAELKSKYGNCSDLGDTDDNNSDHLSVYSLQTWNGSNWSQYTVPPSWVATFRRGGAADYPNYYSAWQGAGPDCATSTCNTSIVAALDDP